MRRIVISACAVAVALPMFAGPVYADPGPGAPPEPNYQPSAQDLALAQAKTNEANNQVQPLTTGQTSKVLTLTVQVQQQVEWCVPASGRAMLTHIATSLPSQSTLAIKMGTSDTTGTYMSNAAPVLTSYVPASTPFAFVFENNVITTADLWGRTTDDVNNHNAALMLRALYGQLPWVGNSNTNGHAVVDRGWWHDSTTNASDLYFWDPADSSYHSTTLAEAWRFNASAGYQEVW